METEFAKNLKLRAERLHLLKIASHGEKRIKNLKTTEFGQLEDQNKLLEDEIAKLKEELASSGIIDIGECLEKDDSSE